MDFLYTLIGRGGDDNEKILKQSIEKLEKTIKLSNQMIDIYRDGKMQYGNIEDLSNLQQKKSNLGFDIDEFKNQFKNDKCYKPYADKLLEIAEIQQHIIRVYSRWYSYCKFDEKLMYTIAASLNALNEKEKDSEIIKNLISVAKKIPSQIGNLKNENEILEKKIKNLDGENSRLKRNRGELNQTILEKNRDICELEQTVKQLQQELNERKNKIIRLEEEFDTSRKNMQKERGKKQEVLDQLEEAKETTRQLRESNMKQLRLVNSNSSLNRQDIVEYYNEFQRKYRLNMYNEIMIIVDKLFQKYHEINANKNNNNNNAEDNKGNNNDEEESSDDEDNKDDSLCIDLLPSEMYKWDNKHFIPYYFHRLLFYIYILSYYYCRILRNTMIENIAKELEIDGNNVEIENVVFRLIGQKIDYDFDLILRGKHKKGEIIHKNIMDNINSIFKNDNILKLFEHCKIKKLLKQYIETCINLSWRIVLCQEKLEMRPLSCDLLQYECSYNANIHTRVDGSMKSKYKYVLCYIFPAIYGKNHDNAQTTVQVMTGSLRRLQLPERSNFTSKKFEALFPQEIIEIAGMNNIEPQVVEHEKHPLEEEQHMNNNNNNNEI